MLEMRNKAQQQQQHLISARLGRNSVSRSETMGELRVALKHDYAPLKWRTDGDKDRMICIDGHLSSNIPILAPRKAEWGIARNRKLRFRVRQIEPLSKGENL